MAIDPSITSTSTPQTAPPPIALSLPPTTYAKLFPHAYLAAHLSAPTPLRPNGRLPHESRRLAIHTSALTHTAGSAVVRLGGTAVVCGIRAETLLRSDTGDTLTGRAGDSYKSNKGTKTRTNNHNDGSGGGAGGGDGAEGEDDDDEDIDEEEEDEQEDEETTEEEEEDDQDDEEDEAENRELKAQKKKAAKADSILARRDAQQIARLGLLVPHVELATGCSPLHIPSSSSGGPSPLAQSLTHRLLTLLLASGIVRLADLEIRKQGLDESFAGGGGAAIGAAIGAAAANSDADSTTPKTAPKSSVVAYWTLYLDIVFLSLDGGAHDVAWMALLAALADVRLPHAAWDADAARVVCLPMMTTTAAAQAQEKEEENEEEETRARKLKLRAWPVALTAGCFVRRTGAAEEGESQGEDLAKGSRGQGDDPALADERRWLLADVDDFEEAVCEEMVTMVVVNGQQEGQSDGGQARNTGGGKLLRIEKAGGGALGPDEIREVYAWTVERCLQWTALLKQVSKGTASHRPR